MPVLSLNITNDYMTQSPWAAPDESFFKILDSHPHLIIRETSKFNFGETRDPKIFARKDERRLEPGKPLSKMARHRNPGL
jgi:hypothetical protein